MKQILAIIGFALAVGASHAETPADGLTDLLDRTTNIVVAEVVKYLGNTIDSFAQANHGVEFRITSVLSGAFTEDQTILVNIYAFNDQNSLMFNPGDRYVLFLLPNSPGWWSNLDNWHGIYPHGKFREEAIVKELEKRKNVQH